MSTKSSLSTTNFATRDIPKLRRLKIQESVLLSSLENTLFSLEQDKIVDIQKLSDHKSFESRLKDSFIDIRNMLEDIKITINSYKNMENLDIIGIKKDVFDLEEKLKSFKIHLQTELATLKNRANEIEHELKTNKFVETLGKNKSSRHSTKQFSEIIPSPVRAIINCPFKCPEVQKFQDFLKDKQQRYGGWNEYNHNKFVRIWNKYLGKDNNGNSIQSDDFNENSDEVFIRFRKEIVDNIPDTTFDDVTSHSKWYSEYLSLKSSQQKALDRWKENIRKIKKPSQEVKQKPQNTSPANKINTISTKSQQQRPKNLSQTNIMSRLVKSTEQWKNRCSDNKNLPQIFPVCNEVKRQTHIPTWRLGLANV